jgi:hypothetical protein
LQQLRLSFCTSLTDDSAQAIANYAKELRFLDVDCSLGITVEGIRLIGKHCKNMELVSSSNAAFHRHATFTLFA